MADAPTEHKNGQDTAADNEALMRTIKDLVGGPDETTKDETFEQFAGRMLSPRMSPLLSELLSELVESHARIRECLRRLKKAEEGNQGA